LDLIQLGVVEAELKLLSCYLGIGEHFLLFILTCLMHWISVLNLVEHEFWRI